MISLHQPAQEMSKIPHITFICDKLIGFGEGGFMRVRLIRCCIWNQESVIMIELTVINLRHIVVITFQ